MQFERRTEASIARCASSDPPPEKAANEAKAEEPVERDVDGISTRVFTAEHLAAICLQVGRLKDFDRLTRFIDQGALDAERFEAILFRHGLVDKWNAFRQSFLS